jgi:hypothetical protein
MNNSIFSIVWKEYLMKMSHTFFTIVAIAVYTSAAHAKASNWKLDPSLSAKERAIIAQVNPSVPAPVSQDTLLKFVGVYRDDASIPLNKSSDVEVSVQGDQLVARVIRVGAQVQRPTSLAENLNNVLSQLPLNTRLIAIGADQLEPAFHVTGPVVATPPTQTWYDVTHSFFRLHMDGEIDSLILNGNELIQDGTMWQYPGVDSAGYVHDEPRNSNGGTLSIGTKIR